MARGVHPGRQITLLGPSSEESLKSPRREQLNWVGVFLYKMDSSEPAANTHIAADCAGYPAEDDTRFAGSATHDISCPADACEPAPDAFECLPMEILVAICGHLPVPTAASATNQRLAVACELAWEAAYMAGESAFALTVERIRTECGPPGGRLELPAAVRKLQTLPQFAKLSRWLCWHAARTSSAKWLEHYLIAALHCEDERFTIEKLSPVCRPMLWLIAVISYAGGPPHYNGSVDTGFAKFARGAAYRRLACVSRQSRGSQQQDRAPTEEYDAVAERLFDLNFRDVEYQKCKPAGVLPLIRFLSTDALARTLIYWPPKGAANKGFIAAGFAELTSRSEPVPGKYVVPLWIRCVYDGVRVSSVFEARAEMIAARIVSGVESYQLKGGVYDLLSRRKCDSRNKLVDVGSFEYHPPDWTPALRWVLPLHIILSKPAPGISDANGRINRLLKQLRASVRVYIFRLAIWSKAADYLRNKNLTADDPLPLGEPSLIFTFGHLDAMINTYYGPHTDSQGVTSIVVYDAETWFMTQD